MDSAELGSLFDGPRSASRVSMHHREPYCKRLFSSHGNDNLGGQPKQLSLEL